jgi:DNA adenine methylase
VAEQPYEWLQLPRLSTSDGQGVHGEAKMPKRLKAPFPWFGGKSKVAPLVWQRLGDVDNFIEPFAGSAAVLLARPHPPRVETVNEAGDFTNAWRATDPDTGDPGAVADAACEVLNDLDPYVANAWRSIQRSPEETARWADRPVNELDMHAIHRWLVLGDDAREFRERMRSDPDYFDPKRAGRWVVGLCEWIGGGWAASPDALVEQRSVISGPGQETMYGRGVHAKGERPHQPRQMPRERGRGVAAAGPGLHQKRPALGGTNHPVTHLGNGVHGRPSSPTPTAAAGASTAPTRRTGT